MWIHIYVHCTLTHRWSTNATTLLCLYAYTKNMNTQGSDITNTSVFHFQEMKAG